jgi:hypothetical protein
VIWVEPVTNNSVGIGGGGFDSLAPGVVAGRYGPTERRSKKCGVRKRVLTYYGADNYNRGLH